MPRRSLWLQPPSGPREGCDGVPGARRRIVAQSLAVDMADHRGALGAARPVAAGLVLTQRKCQNDLRSTGGNGLLYCFAVN